jgi:hypothetical protein
VDHQTGIISTVVDLGNTYIVAMAFGPHGQLYVVDPAPPIVVRFNAKTGVLTNVAGAGGTCPQFGGSACYNGDGILAIEAFLNFPTHIAFDCAGNLTISDTGHFRVRQVNKQTGIITTIAGNGQDSYAGDGGLATQTGIGGPRGGSRLGPKAICSLLSLGGAPGTFAR